MDSAVNRRQRAMEHTFKMAERKQRRAEMVRGFTPVPNKRINAAIMSATAEFLLDEVVTKLPKAQQVNEARRLAVRRVTASLPGISFAKRHRAPRPSKSDNPAYRKPVLVKQRCGELCLA